MADNETKEASPSQAEGVQQKSAPAGPTHRRVVRGKGVFRDVVGFSVVTVTLICLFVFSSRVANL